MLDGRRCSKSFAGILLFSRPRGQILRKITCIITGESTNAEIFACLVPGKAAVLVFASLTDKRMDSREEVNAMRIIAKWVVKNRSA